MQKFVCKRSFSVLSDMTHAFWNAMTYGNTGSIPMKSLWKNKTELHDMARMRAITWSPDSQALREGLEHYREESEESE